MVNEEEILALPPRGDWKAIAKYMMLSIMLDNGAINKDEPDGEDRYPEILTIQIAAACNLFFSLNVEAYNEDYIGIICNGCEDDINHELEGYLELSKLLNEFFEIM